MIFGVTSLAFWLKKKHCVQCSLDHWMSFNEDRACTFTKSVRPKYSCLSLHRTPSIPNGFTWWRNFSSQNDPFIPNPPSSSTLAIPNVGTTELPYWISLNGTPLYRTPLHYVTVLNRRDDKHEHSKLLAQGWYHHFPSFSTRPRPSSNLALAPATNDVDENDEAGLQHALTLLRNALSVEDINNRECLGVRNTRGWMSNHGGVIGSASGQHRHWCSSWKRRWAGCRRTVCCSNNFRSRSPRALAEACTLLLSHRATQHACQHLERHRSSNPHASDQDL